jgi:uncharacterized protein DUF6544
MASFWRDHFLAINSSVEAHLRGAAPPEPAVHARGDVAVQHRRTARRLFHMRIDFAGFVPMVGRDAYASGHGSMRGKLLGLVMCPSMLLVPAVSFAAVDDSCVHVTLTDANRSATALVYLDDNGRPRDFRSRGRYADLPGGLRRAEWSTPVSGWREVDGRAFPGRGSAVWKLDDADFSYVELVFADDAITYNPNLVPTRTAARP